VILICRRILSREVFSGPDSLVVTIQKRSRKDVAISSNRFIAAHTPASRAERGFDKAKHLSYDHEVLKGSLRPRSM
jgi:hypothetical protein